MELNTQTGHYSGNYNYMENLEAAQHKQQQQQFYFYMIYFLYFL